MKLKLNNIKELKNALTSEAKPYSSLSEEEKNQYANGDLTWQAPLYVNRHKTIWWYLVIGLLVVGMLAYAILTAAWTFLMALVLFAGFYYYFNSQDIPDVSITVSSLGIKVGEKVYPYAMFKTFWIDHQPPISNEIHFIPNNNYKYELSLNLQAQDIKAVKEYLHQYLPEWADRQRTFTENIIHLIGL